MGRHLFLPHQVMEVVSAGPAADRVGRNHGGQGRGLSLPMSQGPRLERGGVIMTLTLGILGWSS